MRPAGRAESLLTSIVALFLIGFVIVALIAVIWEVKDPLFTDHDFTAATLKGIDLTFLAIIRPSVKVRGTSRKVAAP